MKVIRDYQQAAKALGRSIRYDPGSGIEATVREIVENVRKGGDKALFAYTERFDGARLKSLEVTPREMAAARKSVDLALVKALKFAAAQIGRAHV